MALPLMAQKRVIAAVAETTYGTAATLAASNAIRVINPKFKVNSDTVRRDRQGGLGVDANIGGVKKNTEFSFTTHVAGKGATGVPQWGLLLQACGFALTSQTYAPSSDSSTWKSLTAGKFLDGRRYLSRGAMGTFKLTAEAGAPAQIDWSFKGGWAQDPDDTAILTGMSYDAALPPIWAGAGSLSLGGATTYTKVSKVEIDGGVDVQLREDPNAPGGYLGAWIANRISRITLDPEATAFATKNWWADTTANTTTSFSMIVGTATNNICTITAGNLQVDGGPDYDNRGGKVVDNVSFLVTGDDLTFAFT